MPSEAETRPLRVLHVIGGLELGGAETLLYRIATHPSGNVHHEIICLGGRDWYSTRLEQDGIVVHHLGISSTMSAPARLARLSKLIRTSDADIIHSWMYFANVLAGLLGRRAGIPVVWGIHATDVDRSGVASRISARAGGAGSRWLTDFVVNCSQRSAKVHERLGYSAVPHAVIPNGYDPGVFHPDVGRRAAIRASLGVDDNILVGSITRWHPDKDVSTLLKAMTLVRDRGIPATCVLVGRGLSASNAELASEIEKRGLEDKILLLGLREDVADVLRALDLHVLSSRSEAFPNVVAESMLSGVPNIATNVGDSADMVGDTGWVVEAGDANGIAAAIDHAHRERRDSPRHWHKRRSDARQRIVERYTLDRMMNAYEELWRKLASDERLSRASRSG